jgi:hypothetical protein
MIPVILALIALIIPDFTERKIERPARLGINPPFVAHSSESV